MLHPDFIFVHKVILVGLVYTNFDLWPNLWALCFESVPCAWVRDICWFAYAVVAFVSDLMHDSAVGLNIIMTVFFWELWNFGIDFAFRPDNIVAWHYKLGFESYKVGILY